jgi:tRNA dimethylallyltransferase
MIEEVKKLVAEGITFERLETFGLEYKFVGKYLSGELNHNDMLQKLNSAIHSFAKRQRTWFRKMEREGIKINWIEGPDYEAAKQIISQNYFS